MIQGQLQDWAAMAGGFGLVGWCVYVVAAALRRRQQNEMQKHMLDKFASAQDFAAFTQSAAGQKYVMSFSEAATNPRNMILNSVRTGFVLMFAGAGFLAASSGRADTVGFRIGCVSSLAGIGFLCAALVSYFLAKRIGSTEKD
jgi:hypothetical protein